MRNCSKWFNLYSKYPSTVLASYFTYGAVWKLHGFMSDTVTFAEKDGFNLFIPTALKSSIYKLFADLKYIYSAVYESSTRKVLTTYFHHQPEEANSLLNEAASIIKGSPRWTVFNLREQEEFQLFIHQLQITISELLDGGKPS